MFGWREFLPVVIACAVITLLWIATITLAGVFGEPSARVPDPQTRQPKALFNSRQYLLFGPSIDLAGPPKTPPPMQPLPADTEIHSSHLSVWNSQVDENGPSFEAFFEGGMLVYHPIPDTRMPVLFWYKLEEGEVTFGP
jgi:hypothetical protein